MISLLINARPRKTTLVFPDEQKLWAFFASAQVADFRIESSNHAFTGKLQQNDIELAKEKLGAREVNEETKCNNSQRNVLNQNLSFSQLLFPSSGLMRSRTLCQ